MTVAIKTSPEPWTRKQGILLAVLCLLAGIAGGWTIRATQKPAGVAPPQAVGASTTGNGEGSLGVQSNSVPPRGMADAQAAPLLAQLKAAPNDPALLTSLGNLYYDAQQYPTAVDYYGRVLKSRPSDAAVRTDMATAYWYMGNADNAMAEFNRALMDAPTNPNTLFNLGVVKWKGKRDAAGALAVWEKLLAANPTYEGRDKVEQMMAEARQNQAVPSK